ncbi:hypothetical protein MWU60_06785 [Yoonia sp. F2084L]|uniref:hypothetical protein n=1 Tax=Yoonia sp. F2084L TaxID=2926419 RepID=UPI001FF637D0|nr:hypothetical protein [Yoonia sp. F2084L]MCK0095271.1 hypothetical protein [Yoonia sp. F2084L]
MKQRQKMQTFDWFNWLALVAIGVFLGLVIDGFVDLATVGAWGSILMLLGLSAAGVVFYLFVERVMNFISIGRFSQPQQLQKPRKPLALHFALPVGIIIGLIGAQFGLADLIL